MSRTLRSKKLRSLLYYEHDGKCAICGCDLPPDWHADHIVPYSKTGRTNVHEMQPLCPPCNLSKSDTTMQLRRFQSDFHALNQRKIEGGAESVRDVLVHVTPGGGKSLLPSILAKYAQHLNARICWVVPRVSLMTQGAQDFRSEWARRLIGHSGELRETQNDINPTRGKLGYLTTYHAVGQNPALHAQEFNTRPYLLFCDEIHHVEHESNWHRALQPMVDQARFRVFASGTLERGDGNPIAFLPYSLVPEEGGYLIDTGERTDWEEIRYSRSEAISDGAILPLNFRILDGTAQWVDRDGNERETESLADLGSDDARDALATFLRTEAAHEIIDTAVEDWTGTREQYSQARLLIAAPDRNHARLYKKYIEEEHNHRCGLAIISDKGGNKKALRAIKQFKPKPDGTGKLDILVTVAMAYEGLNVKPITHVACLTRYRTRPWIEQLVDRANRIVEGKPEPTIYAPDDPFFERIRQEIEAEQEQAVKPENMWNEPDAGGDGQAEEASDPRSIVPIASSVLRERGIYNGEALDYDLTETIKTAMKKLGMKEDHPGKIVSLMNELGVDLSSLSATRPAPSRPNTTPKQREARLREDIDNHIKKYVGEKCSSGQSNYGELIQQVNKHLYGRFGKRDEVTEEQLRRCWAYVQRRYPLQTKTA